MPSPTPPIRPVLRLIVQDVTEARFVGAANATRVEVDRNPTIVGRSPDVDVVIVDPGARISRSHLLLERRGLHWTVSDVGSRHGSLLWQRGVGRTGLTLQPHMRHRISGEAHIRVADVATLIVIVEPVELTGGRTADDPDPVSQDFAFPKERHIAFAFALTEPLRNPVGSLTPEPATAAAIAQALGIARTAVYPLADEVAALPMVKRALQLSWTSGSRPEGWRRDLAEALIHVFPDRCGHDATT